jgi:hypothetical protein
MAVWRIPVVQTGPVLHAAVNVFHMQTTGAANADAQTAIDAVRDFYTTIAAHFNSTATISVGGNTRRVDVDPPTIPSVVTRQVAGTGSGSVASWQLAQVVSWRTQTAGRSYRGRTYLGPLNASVVNGNVINSSFITTAGTAATALVATGMLVIRSEWANGVKRVTPLHTPVTQYILNGTVETQRRRATP